MRRTTSDESRPDSPAGGGGDEVNQEEGGEEGEKKDKGEATPPKDPLTTTEASQKRKVSLEKPSARKKARTNKPQSKNVLTVDDIDLIITVIEDASEDILQRQGAKQESMYDRIEKELKDIQQAIHSSRAVPTAPSSAESVELGDEPTQLRRLADATEARLHRAQEEKEQATEAMKQEKEEALEKLRVAQQEKDEIRAMFEEDKEKMQKEKDQLLAEQTVVKEAVTRALRSVSGLAQEEPESTEMQVGKLVEAIQQLQARVMELEIQAVPSTPQEVHDQREEAARNAVERIRALASECKQLSDRSAQTYEHLAEDPELRKLEAQLQEAKQQASTMQAQMKLLTAVEKMKRSQEQCAQSSSRSLPSRAELWRLHRDSSQCRTKPACFLKRSKDKAHSWNRWSQQWNNAWKGLSPSK
jgi:hypothetical protein